MKKCIIKTPQDFVKWMSGCKDVFSLDTETTSLNYLDLEMIGFSISDGVKACYVVLSEYNERERVYTNSVHKAQILCTLDFYIQEAKLIIMHNAPFDMLVLKKEGIEI